jgi:cytidylate kinase
MTREMGTLGKDVAREFAHRKGYTVVHHELIRSENDRAATREESEVYRFLEGSEVELASWRNNRAPDGFLTPEEVLEIALEGQVLIRGWGAARLLKSVPQVLSVRVCAPMAFRVDVIKDRLGVDARTAQREIERSDAAHSRTFSRFFESDWRDPENYDIVLNTSHVDPPTCAAILLDAVANEAFCESGEMRLVLKDMLIKERIMTTLHAHPLLGGRGQHLEVSVEDKDVRLYGIVNDGQSRGIVEGLLAGKFGLRSLQNDIVRTSGFTE